MEKAPIWAVGRPALILTKPREGNPLNEETQLPALTPTATPYLPKGADLSPSELEHVAISRTELQKLQAAIEKRIDRAFDEILVQLREAIEMFRQALEREPIKQPSNNRQTKRSSPSEGDRSNMHLRDRIDQDFLKELGL